MPAGGRVAVIGALVVVAAVAATQLVAAHRPRAAARTTDARAFGVEGAYAVGSYRVDVVEPAATAAAVRRLPTAVWYPVLRRSAGTQRGAVADRARAPYPLVVFSQGYAVSRRAYFPLLEALASAGFVVAAPAYPHTSPSDRTALDETDILNHPADLRAVITAVLRASSRPGSPLSGLVAAGEIGVAGHSDGGDVSLAVAAGSCCRDRRVKAAAILSGAELTSFGGDYFASRSVPLLVVQGSADTVNPPACSVQIYDDAPRPKYYLHLVGARHETPYVAPGPYRSIVARVVIDFFAAELAGKASARSALEADGTVPGRARLFRSPSAPPAAGGCPGAPG